MVAQALSEEGSTDVDVTKVVADEAVLNEALALARERKFEFVEQQSRLLGKKGQQGEAPPYSLRVAQ